MLVFSVPFWLIGYVLIAALGVLLVVLGRNDYPFLVLTRIGALGQALIWGTLGSAITHYLRW